MYAVMQYTDHKFNIMNEVYIKQSHKKSLPSSVLNDDNTSGHSFSNIISALLLNFILKVKLCQVDLLVFAFGSAVRVRFRAPESHESQFSTADCPTPARSASCDRAPGRPGQVAAAPRRQCLLRFRQCNLQEGEGIETEMMSHVRLCCCWQLTDALLAHKTTAWSSCRSLSANPIDASIQIQVLKQRDL